MAFIQKTDPVVLNIKLTTKGRELLSTGNLKFNYYAIGDSEIDYAFNSETGNIPFDSNILRPADNNPNIISFIPKNLSGDPYNVIPSVPSTWYPVINTIEPIGFFTSGCTSFITDSNHVKQPDAMIDMSTVVGGTSLVLLKAPTYGTSGEEPAVGDLVLVKWTLNANTTGHTINKTSPTPYLIYQVVSIVTGSLASGSVTITVDRELPDFTGYAPTGKAGALIYYNYINFSGNTIFNVFSTDYLDESVLAFLQNSQCPTVIFPFWNMTIIYTEEIAGVSGNNRTFGQFNSATYGGFVSYIQNQAPFYKKLGIIHYTNSSPANVYAEGFYLNTAVLDIPTIMWHKNSTPTLGAKFVAGNGYTLVDLGIHYYDLVDASNPNIKVGKMFDELKMFLIEDQELLFAMSYKSNRSWTLPEYALGGGSGGCPPVPPAPVVLSVQTIIGQAGSIKNTGGFNIVGFASLTEYGIDYRISGTSGDFIRERRFGALTSNSFSIDITGTTPSTAYEYRAYVKIGNNEAVDLNTHVITTLPAPIVPPTPPPIIPTVATTLGTGGIGQINGTGGNSIPANVFIAIEKYWMEYRVQSLADWIVGTQLSGPLSVDNFTLSITGLINTVSTPYEYRAVIQVAGVAYSGNIQLTTVQAQAVPTTYAPQVTTGSIFKQLSNNNGTIDALTKLNQIVDKGSLPLTEYGLVYTQDLANYDPAKLIYGGAGIGKVSFVQDYPNPTGAFAITIIGLLDSSAIYFRAFAQNSSGIGYGEIAYDETIPLVVVPPTNSIFICGACQLAPNTDVRSCFCAHLGVSTPLLAGQNIVLCFTDNAYSQSNVALSHPISSCSWISCSPSTSCCNFASSMVFSGGDPGSCSQEKFGSINIDSSNIDCYVLHAVATSSPADTGQDFTNTASVNLTCALNSGGANYSVGALSSLEAYNTGGGGGSCGGGIPAPL